MFFDINRILCKYNWYSKMEAHIEIVLTMIDDMAFKKLAFNKRGKAIPKGKTKIQIMSKSIEGSQKKGCQCTFMLKTFYLLPAIT